MATGIISIATHLLGMETLAWALFDVGKGAYALLWLLTLARLALYHQQMVADISDQARGPGFLTISAASCVLGSQFVLLAGDFHNAIFLWFVGALFWAILTYAFFTAMAVRRSKPGLERGISGEWLLVVVAGQSVSILGTLVALHLPDWQESIHFAMLTLYLLSCMLYLLIIGPIFSRIMFSDLTAEELRPSYWINMGAVAITTLAGDVLLLNASEWEFLEGVLPFLRGFTLFFWASATWWIPLLLTLGVWRHLFQRYPLRYDPQYWSLVFPLGMYTASTLEMARALEMDFLVAVPRYFIYVALLAWVAALAGMVWHIARTVLGPDS